MLIEQAAELGWLPAVFCALLDMKRKDISIWRYRWLALAVNPFFCWIAFAGVVGNSIVLLEPRSETSPYEQAPRTDHSKNTQTNSKPSTESDGERAKSKTQAQGPATSSKSTFGPKKSADASSNEEKKRQALLLLENVLLGTEKIIPLEYQILTQVEAANVLWQFDKQQAVSILKSAVKAMRRILEEKNITTEVNSYRRTKEQMLWFLAIRKIAALDPKLVGELLLPESDKAENTNDAPRIKGVWTEEARAMLSIASEMIERDPKLAARTAEQTLPLGLASYLEFLRSLARRDNAEAERLAIVIIDRFRNISVTPLELRNLMVFVFAPERTSRLRNYFSQALAARLRMEFRADATADDLADALGVANVMAREAGRESPYWKQEFDSISLRIATLFKRGPWLFRSRLKGSRWIWAH